MAVACSNLEAELLIEDAGGVEIADADDEMVETARGGGSRHGDVSQGRRLGQLLV
jgi:hypothetical protein